MYLEWTAHLQNEEEKENFRNTVKAARPVLERLAAIVDKKENELERLDISPEVFKDPNWPYHQAYRNGIRKALTGFKELINLDKQITKGN